MRDLRSLRTSLPREYLDIHMQCCCQALQMEPAGGLPLLWLRDRLWCKVSQTHFLCKSLVNCSSWTIGHYPYTDWLFVQDSLKSIWKPSSAVVRQEASVLAHRVIHSVSRTQRGLSSPVSLLLAFKECVCLHTHMQECIRVCVRARICPCSNTG